jgi:4-diphosphocytidyl-2-C-methyl-D-erythritol kinase
VNFFLQPNPALAYGRGERIRPLKPFDLMKGASMLLFHPGFGVATPWAFKELARFPEARDGRPGRAADAASAYGGIDREAAGAALYNGLEVPVLRKFPLLALIQECLRANGAWGALMSGSGSTTFGLFHDRTSAERAAERVRADFGHAGWLTVADL